MKQVELHKEIDTLLGRNPVEVTAAEVESLISDNPDACHYFFEQADARWLSWLWDKGFLDVLKKKADNLSRYGYLTPEVNYLVRMGTSTPAETVDIMLQVSISKKTLNPEVVDRFLWICGSLPADQLARMVPKIKKESWVRLMGHFNDWGFEYEKMFQILAHAGDYENMLILARAVLEVRPREELDKDGYPGISTENPFYFNDLSYTKVFEHLVALEGEYAERGLGLTIKVLSDIVRLGGPADKDEVFSIQDSFHLFDVDFFTLEVGQKKRLSHRDDVRDLAAAVKQLTVKTIGAYDTDQSRAKELYQRYFVELPDSRSMWRLQLFALSIYPEYFKEELKDAFFRLFDVDRYYEIIGGAEYERALKKSFHLLDEGDQREYVARVFSYFTGHDQEKEDQDWHLRYGSQILSVIEGHLTEKEKREANKSKFILNPGYEPESTISEVKSGSVVPKAPITQEEFRKLSILDIGERLRGEWKPEALTEKNKSEESFFNPLNAEGASSLLQTDIKERLEDYISNAPLFFDKEDLDPHYTHSFLRGIQDAVKENKEMASAMNWSSLLALCEAIRVSGEESSFEDDRRNERTHDAWLSDWRSVHSAMADVLQVLIEGEKAVIDFSSHRDALFNILSYLLTYPDPIPEDEEIETARMRSSAAGSKEYQVSDPLTTAINTVRGRAYQALVLFLYHDGKHLPRDVKSKIADDVKKLYEKVLDTERTRAIMFMYGHYLPSFYFRDEDWIKGLSDQIFSEDQNKRHLYAAAWEGYLANNLYREMFLDPVFQGLYERGIDYPIEDDPTRKHFRDPDEGIATHLALAFMHYDDFGFEHPLFKKFWSEANPELHADFVSFLGRAFVSGSNDKADQLLREEPRAKQRLKELWDYVLENHTDSRIFTNMGFWINMEKDIFEAAWLANRAKKTLQKAEGTVEWDYGMMKSITALAEAAPEDSLMIVRTYLLEGGVRGGESRRPLHVDTEWHKAFEILYNNESTKEGTYNLIDELIREGGSTFWGLKKILGE